MAPSQQLIIVPSSLPLSLPLIYSVISYTASSPPEGLEPVVVGITSFNVQWREPEMPNGVITSYEVNTTCEYKTGTIYHMHTVRVYQVLVEGGSSKVSYDGLSAVVSELIGNTEYTVTVRAINGAGDGELSPPRRVTTDAGAVPPNILGVTTNLESNRYILQIGGFEKEFGPLRLVCCALWVTQC